MSDDPSDAVGKDLGALSLVAPEGPGVEACSTPARGNTGSVNTASTPSIAMRRMRTAATPSTPTTPVTPGPRGGGLKNVLTVGLATKGSGNGRFRSCKECRITFTANTLCIGRAASAVTTEKYTDFYHVSCVAPLLAIEDKRSEDLQGFQDLSRRMRVRITVELTKARMVRSSGEEGLTQSDMEELGRVMHASVATEEDEAKKEKGSDESGIDEGYDDLVDGVSSAMRHLGRLYIDLACSEKELESQTEESDRLRTQNARLAGVIDRLAEAQVLSETRLADVQRKSETTISKLQAELTEAHAQLKRMEAKLEPKKKSFLEKMKERVASMVSQQHKSSAPVDDTSPMPSEVQTAKLSLLEELLFENRPPRDGDERAMVQAARSEIGVAKFNGSGGKKGVAFLKSRGVFGDNPAEVAAFLKLGNNGLCKRAIGEYLGDRANGAVLAGFAETFSFADMSFIEALRSFLRAFVLPGETQVIERLIDAFGIEFMKQRGCDTGIANAESAAILGFSTIMLNVDLFNPNVKKRMDGRGFVRNNRGLNPPGSGGNFPETLLLEIYKSLKARPLQFPDA